MYNCIFIYLCMYLILSRACGFVMCNGLNGAVNVSSREILGWRYYVLCISHWLTPCCRYLLTLCCTDIMLYWHHVVLTLCCTNTNWDLVPNLWYFLSGTQSGNKFLFPDCAWRAGYEILWNHVSINISWGHLISKPKGSQVITTYEILDFRWI